MTIEIGEPAPDFRLPDQDGNEVSSKALRGKWVVLYFYPKDDTPGCTIEGLEFTANKEGFERAGAAVLGISADDAKSHCAFRQKHGIGITLLTDAGHGVMERYGAYGEKTLYGRRTVGIVRSTVILDPQGRLAFRWKKVRAEGHARQALAKLGELRAGTRHNRYFIPTK